MAIWLWIYFPIPILHMGRARNNIISSFDSPTDSPSNNIYPESSQGDEKENDSKQGYLMIYLYKLFIFISGLLFLLLFSGLIIAKISGEYLVTPPFPFVLPYVILFFMIFFVVFRIKTTLKTKYQK